MIIKRYKNLRLCIESSLVKEIANLAIRHYPNEYGGFLLGYYSNNFSQLNVEQLILADKYTSSPTDFRRKFIIIDNIFKETGLYYIGGGSHPDVSAWYSLTDLRAMNNITSCRTVQINNPVLLILSISSSKL